LKIQQQQYACDDPMIEHMCNETTVLHSLWCQICRHGYYSSILWFPKFGKIFQNFSI